MRAIALTVAVATLLSGTVSARAVNISNTWMLPEEGFPVFYRYFRDRISWNEADAVCQFHHANLVTVDATSQYDAIRAYLKELDIASNVWIGLSRAADKDTFAWRDFRELSAPDYWQEAIPAGGGAPLCAATDPAADFRWRALACGGPEAASFICELPVPTWANGVDGCLVTELPSLTVLYVPEQSAVELTSDCGLDGTKRIVCKGKADRDELVRRLACTEDSVVVADGRTTLAQSATSPASTTIGHSPPRTTKPHIWTSNTIDGGDYGAPTRHRRETEETSAHPAAESTTELAATLGTTSQRAAASSTEADATPPALDASSREEFASAISQGQLFGIIENGTLFDIIELNGTEENKTLAPDASARTTVASVASVASEAAASQSSMELTKEALPALPALGSKDLRRTFRKQAPDVDAINDVKPLGRDGARIANVIAAAVKEIALAAEAAAIDQSRAEIETTRSPLPEENRYESEPTTKPNRQRQLTRSNRRSFYPYFFSRVLG